MYIIVTAMTRILPIDAETTKAMYLGNRLTYTSTTPETNLHLERVKKNWDKQTFSCHVVNDWNGLTVEHREIEQFA
jgi:hypothetical protein